MIGGLIILVVLALGGYLAYRATIPGQDKVRDAADSAADELERTPVKGLGINIFDVDQALSASARDSRGRSYASELRVKSVGTDSRGDLYEITNSHGDHPVCLVVSVDVDLLSDDPAFPTTEVSDGHC
ncbi:hypothetical protein [Rugosimonospora africana]|uniref:hypothetical protein n=1 Tax=Rugosimonospora africana TaxID=556532 RepID=UPI001940A36B|nr:hypothetical protein [Rugosimonospora africana]